jgi:hypothetical protein
MKEEANPPVQDREQEAEACFSCLGTNTPGSHFCTHCGTPLTSYAATGPIEHLFAFGDFIRKAAQPGRWSRPVRAVVLVFVFLTLLAVLFGLIMP